MASTPDPLPKPKPDTIEPQSPPEHPAQPAPPEDPAGQPLEIPGHPGGGDTDEPGRGPSEVPPGQVEAQSSKRRGDKGVTVSEEAVPPASPETRQPGRRWNQGYRATETMNEGKSVRKESR